MKKSLIIFTTLIFALTANPVNSAFAAESLIVKTFKGEEFDLSKLRGKIIVVNFWTSWCPFCRAEMITLEDAYKKYQNKNLEIIGIDIDKLEDNKNDALKVAEKFTYSMARFSDIKKTSFHQPSAFPISYIIDVDGKIIGDAINNIDALKQALSSALKVNQKEFAMK
jgi:cytochrome c biogenesis protein CcmG, thiol:disulfide interchange protein DsbE